MGETKNPTPLCAVIGTKGAGKAWSDEVSEDAFRVGRLVVEAGFDLVTGGMGGVMSVSAEGCRSVGGRCIGLLPGEDHTKANPHLTNVMPTGIGLARNSLTALAGSAVIALPGGRGTLEEISFALDYLRPVMAWPYWAWLHDAPDGLFGSVQFSSWKGCRPNRRHLDWDRVRYFLEDVHSELRESGHSHLACR